MKKSTILVGLIILVILWTDCTQKPFAHGKIMYENFCLNCHMEDGSGLMGNIPPLAKADYLVNHAAELPCIIRYGIQDTLIVNGKKYTTPMEGIPQLTDVEITNIINYINQEWGNNNGYTSIKQVQERLAKCENK